MEDFQYIFFTIQVVISVGCRYFFMSVQLSGGGVNNQYIPRWSGKLADEETSEADYYKERTINILNWLVGHTER